MKRSRSPQKTAGPEAPDCKKQRTLDLPRTLDPKALLPRSYAPDIRVLTEIYQMQYMLNDIPNLRFLACRRMFQDYETAMGAVRMHGLPAALWPYILMVPRHRISLVIPEYGNARLTVEYTKANTLRWLVDMPKGSEIDEATWEYYMTGKGYQLQQFITFTRPDRSNDHLDSDADSLSPDLSHALIPRYQEEYRHVPRSRPFRLATEGFLPAPTVRQLPETDDDDRKPALAQQILTRLFRLRYSPPHLRSLNATIIAYQRIINRNAPDSHHKPIHDVALQIESAFVWLLLHGHINKHLPADFEYRNRPFGPEAAVRMFRLMVSNNPSTIAPRIIELMENVFTACQIDPDRCVSPDDTAEPCSDHDGSSIDHDECIPQISFATLKQRCPAIERSVLHALLVKADIFPGVSVTDEYEPLSTSAAAAKRHHDRDEHLWISLAQH